MRRSAASHRHTFYMFEGSYIQHDFSIQATCITSVNNMAYSNDGPADQINIIFASEMVGSFTTITEFGNGFLWNEIRNTGPVGKNVSLPPGSHFVRLKVVHSDVNGVELDKTTLKFTCNKDPEVSGGSSADPSSPLSDTQIAGMVIGATSIVIVIFLGIPGCILAIVKLRNKVF